MGDMDGRVCVVTGANTGIGAVTARELARRGAHVVLACRSLERANPVAEAIRADTGNEQVEVVPLDLGSFESVRACAEGLLARDLPIHVLVNNAGLAGTRGVTRDGFELAFGTNHLGHFLLTNLLLDRIRQSGPSRVVTVASRGHYRARGIDYEAVRQPTRTTTGFPEYTVSKLANVLFSAELARRLAGTNVTTYSLHPGVVASDIWRRVPGLVRPIMKLFMITNEEGAQTTLHCATDPAAASQTGLYWDQRKPKKPNPVAEDPAAAAELWRRSAEWTGVGG